MTFCGGNCTCLGLHSSAISLFQLVFQSLDWSMCINYDYSAVLVGFRASNSALEDFITLKLFYFFFLEMGAFVNFNYCFGW